MHVKFITEVKVNSVLIWYDNLFIILSHKGYFYNEMNITEFIVNWNII